MSKSIAPSRGTKPRKPHPDFPLFPHATGRWAKKVRGKLHYFGPWADPDAAANKWAEQKDDLLAGRKPRVKGDGLTVRELVNRFLTFKQQLLDSGELAPRTFQRYHATSEMLITALGRDRMVEDLDPDDFQALRASMAKRWGPVALGNEIQIVRSIFRYGDEAGLIEKSIKYGPGFKKPSAKTLRMTRSSDGPRVFQPQQIQALLKAAAPHLGAMVLLGINGGLGNTDLGMLPMTALALDTGWVNYPRPKTGMPRRIPLWPETVRALRKALAKRPEPKNEADAGLVFIGPRGENYVGKHKGYRVTQAMDQLFAKAKIEGRTFYDLRRTFQTIGEDSHDLVAVQSIMGHAPASGDMSALYRQGISDARLAAVVEHVRTWLFPPRKTRAKSGAGRASR